VVVLVPAPALAAARISRCVSVLGVLVTGSMKSSQERTSSCIVRGIVCDRCNMLALFIIQDL
jgi:hypothetical protein